MYRQLLVNVNVDEDRNGHTNSHVKASDNG